MSNTTPSIPHSTTPMRVDIQTTRAEEDGYHTMLQGHSKGGYHGYYTIETRTRIPDNCPRVWLLINDARAFVCHLAPGFMMEKQLLTTNPHHVLRHYAGQTISISRYEDDDLPQIVESPTMTTIFTAYGIPRPQGSKRPIGKGRYVEASKYLLQWRETVAAAAMVAHGPRPPHKNGCEGRLTFYFPLPKTHPERAGLPYLNTPDLDKLERAVGDSLTAAHVITDDKIIYRWNNGKYYCSSYDDPARVEVEISSMIGGGQ